MTSTELESLVSPKRWHFDIEDGVACVEGEVDNLAEKHLALERVAHSPNVEGVIDQLRVHSERQVEDEELGRSVALSLARDDDLTVCALSVGTGGGKVRRTVRPVTRRTQGSIDIAVKDGVVSLTGDVRSLAQKRLAGVVAWEVAGVRDVVNLLESCPEVSSTAEGIRKGVLEAFARDSALDAKDIGVLAHGNSVVLVGRVASERERVAAECDAWRVFDVIHVDNELEVSRPLELAGRA